MTDRFRRTGVTLAIFAVLGVAACASPEPGVARGEAIYDTCVPCHGADGQGNRDLSAPSIAGLPQWYVQAQLEKFTAGLRGGHPLDTVGIRMKSMALSLDMEGDLVSVSEYVATMPFVDVPPSLPGGDPELGQEMYQQVCVACHQADASGFQGAQAPPLVGQHDWYLMGQYLKFRNGLRGYSPDDPFGRTMVANSQQFSPEEMINIIAYIETLPMPSPPAAESGQ